MYKVAIFIFLLFAGSTYGACREEQIPAECVCYNNFNGVACSTDDFKGCRRVTQK